MTWAINWSPVLFYTFLTSIHFPPATPQLRSLEYQVLSRFFFFHRRRLWLMWVNCDNEKYLVNWSIWITSRNFSKNCFILENWSHVFLTCDQFDALGRFKCAMFRKHLFFWKSKMECPTICRKQSKNWFPDSVCKLIVQCWKSDARWRWPLLQIGWPTSISYNNYKSWEPG